MAYYRLIPTDKIITLGQVLVKSESRGIGLGKNLLYKVLVISEDMYPDKPIFVQAQGSLQQSYSALAFTPISAPYLEDNTLHIDLLLEEFYDNIY